MFLFCVLIFWLRGMWDDCTQTSDWTWILCIRRGILNHWTTRKVPYKNFVVVSLSHVWLFVNAWSATLQASLSFTISQGFLKLTPIELMMPSNHLVFCCSLFLLHSIFPSIRVFSNEFVLCIRWPKYWSSIFSISPSSEHSRLISFRIDWFDLCAVQGTLRSPLQGHSWKESINYTFSIYSFQFK